MMTDDIAWYDIDPADAVDFVLPRPGITGPLDTQGRECPWPWGPQQRTGIGQYHCAYCGEMVVGGQRHVDYRDDLDVP
jgi:hypothetical protein